MVGGLAANPTPLNHASPVAFIASGLSDASPGIPGIAQVQFWIAAAPATTLNTATDTLLGLGIEQLYGNWVLNLANLTGFAPGSYVLFARAQDTNGVWGAAVSLDVTLT